VKNVSVLQEVLGVTDPNAPDAMVQAYNTLTGENLNDTQLRMEGARLARAIQQPETLSIDDDERWMALNGIAMVLQTGSVLLADTLTCWLDYHNMIRKHGQKANDSARALMVGSTDALSSRSFVALAESEYGADSALVVDLQGGRDKRSHGRFIRGDGLHMPFRTNTIDFFHTNQLLYTLSDTAQPANRRDSIRTVLAEGSRVLRPGGQLLMRETAPDVSGHMSLTKMQTLAESFSLFLHNALSQVGFGEIQIEQATFPTNLAHLADPQRNFDDVPFNWVAGCVTVYARKFGA
jgi:SAM-dependent methyltransferase